MSNDNEVPGSMVIVAQGPDDQYAYEVPPIDSAAVAGNMFGDLIQRDIYLQKNIYYPVRSIFEQGTKEKKEINKKVSDQVDGLLKQITQGKREATRQERVDVMSAVLHKMESDLEGYK
ncbi:pyocin S5, partial [Pseudomonas aeruginosa]|nr:pyocin S5 [Pseudomonas aeruginosa]